MRTAQIGPDLRLIHDTIKKYLLLLKEMSSISSDITGNTTRVNAPINVNPVGGVRARGGDLTNFRIF